MALPAPKSPLGMKKAPTQIPIMMRTLNNQNLKEKKLTKTNLIH